MARTVTQIEDATGQPSISAAALGKIAKRPAKYRNTRTEAHGKTFASKKEAKRYDEVLLLQKAKQINSLKCQHRFPLKVEGVLVATYVADFFYHDIRTGKQVVEDVKGLKLPLFEIKAKLLKILHGLEVVVI